MSFVSWVDARWLGALALLLSFSALGCGDLEGDAVTSGNGSGRQGDACAGASDCRPGLACEEGLCAPSGDVEEGGRCTLTLDCAESLYCAENGVCTRSGTAGLGDTCLDTSDCAASLYCQYLGFVGVCSEHGRGDVADECTSAGDCLAGLGCDTDDTCKPGVTAGGVVPFAGVECDEPNENAPFQIYFEIPRPDEPVDEFYRLPFPNDIRITQDRVDLDGHPLPDLERPGNVLRSTLAAIEADARGYGVRQAILFRLSQFPDPDSVVISGEDPVMFLVNIDADSPRLGRRNSMSWSATNQGGKYICPNWLGVRPLPNQPLDPDTTYAVVITDRIRDGGGRGPTQPADLTAVLGGTAPEDPVLADAFQAYAPLRDYLRTEGISAASVASAAVFTTESVELDLNQLARAAAMDSPAELDELVLCTEGRTSPCEDGLVGEEHVRGCFSAREDFWELHARVPLSAYQTGRAPYQERGGAVLFQDDALPIRQRRDSVCASMTVPRTMAMPATGWPVVFFDPGAGGNFRSQVDELGADLSALGYATFSLEPVVHGDRANGALEHPVVLYHNHGNPRAVLGNQLQTVLDQLAIGAILSELDIAAESSPTGARLSFDESRLVLFAHSTGASAAAITLAGSHPFDAAVLSAGGGGVLNWLVDKREPIDISQGLHDVVDEASSLNSYHPVLNLLQMYYEPLDPLNYARHILSRRTFDRTLPDVYMTWGLGDLSTPDETIEELADEIGLPVVEPLLTDLDWEVLPLPVSGNVDDGDGLATAVLAQFEATEGTDPHRVAFDNPTARSQILGFLRSYNEARLGRVE